MPTGIAPTDELLNTIQQAVGNGDVSTLKAVAPLTANTNMAGVVDNTIKGMSGTAVPAMRVMQTANDNGGLQSKDGRLSAADSMLQEYTKAQPERSFWRGLGLSLIGDPNAYKAFNEGAQEQFLAPGADNKFYRVVKNTNSGIPSAVFDEQGQVVPLADAMKLGVTGFKSITETPGYKSNMVKTEEYAKKNVNEITNANAWASAFKAIDNNNQNILNGLQQIKQSGLALPTDILRDINSVAARTGSLAQSYSDSVASLAQANDTTSRNNAINNANKFAAEAGWPKIVSIDANHNVTTDDGKSYSLSNFLQNAKTMTSSQQSENAWRAGKAEIVNSAWYKNLAASPEGQKLIPVFENVFNMSASNDILKKQTVEKHGWLPFLTPNMPFDPSKSIESNMVQSMLDHGNALKAKEYAGKLSTMMQTGVPVVPGSVMSTYSNTDGAKVDEQLGAAIQQALSSYKPTAITEVPETQPKTLKQKNELLNPAQQGRMARTGNLKPNAPNPAVEAMDTAAKIEQILSKHKKGVK